MTLQYGPALDLGWVDKRRAQTPTNTSPIGTIANFDDDSSLDTRLAAISGTAYSAANLRCMTTNDKIFALRTNDEAAGL